MQILLPDGILEVRDAATQVGIIVLVDQGFDLLGDDAGLKYLQHDRGKIRSAAAVNDHGFIFIDDQVWVAVQPGRGIVKANPENPRCDFNCTLIIRISMF